MHGQKPGGLLIHVCPRPPTIATWPLSHLRSPSSTLWVDRLLACLDLFTGPEPPEVYLVGAYEEPRGTSEQVAGRLLRMLHQETPKPLRLRLACILGLNTDPATQAPRARHLSLHCATGEASPAGFADRGPELPRRFAHRTCLAYSGEAGEGAGSPLVQVAHHAYPGVLALPGFSTRIPSWVVMGLERMTFLPDEDFLRLCSTSPLVRVRVGGAPHAAGLANVSGFFLCSTPTHLLVLRHATIIHL